MLSLLSDPGKKCACRRLFTLAGWNAIVYTKIPKFGAFFHFKSILTENLFKL
jgi:hypothetical protein